MKNYFESRGLGKGTIESVSSLMAKCYTDSTGGIASKMSIWAAPEQETLTG